MPYTAKQVDTLQTERTDDPLARSYSGMTDAQFLASITTEDRTALNQVSSRDIFEAMDPAEAPTFGTQEADIFGWVLTTAAGAPVTLDGNIRAALLQVFAPGTSRTNLAALEFLNISRATEIGLPEPSLGDVERTS